MHALNIIRINGNHDYLLNANVSLMNKTIKLFLEKNPNLTDFKGLNVSVCFFLEENT